MDHGKKEGHGHKMKSGMMEKDYGHSNETIAKDKVMDELGNYEEGMHPVEEMGDYKEGMHKDEGYHNEDMHKEGMHKEGMHKDEAVYEIDEADLVSELRRLRVMTKINNTKKRQQRQKALQEAQLRQIIEEEVDNVFKDLENGKLDLNISGDWVYGNSKPRNSRRGRIARGFKSIGFK
jgi:hypothetical protein